jgi:hypothetical protein
MRWLLSRVGEDWAELAPRVARESEQARAAEEALKQQRVERGRAARDERLALQAREEEEKNKRGNRENGFEVDRPATPTTSSGDAARVVPGAFGSPVDHPG